MAQTAVDIVVKVAGGERLKQLDASLKGTAANSVKASAGLDKSAKSAQNLGNKARGASGGVNQLAGAVRGLVTAAALLGTAKFVIAKTSELETQTRSLKVLTGELETAEKIIERLQKFSAVTPFTSSELIETSKRLAAFGVDTEKLVDTTKRLADVSGATGARLTEVATAYGQIQAKGRLQGEELLQLQERGIALQDELQKMYGLTGEEFSKALQKGRISAEAVEVAIKRLTEAGGKYADGAISQSDTLAGKFSTLIDGIENIARTLGNVLSPALKTILDQAISVVNSINAALAAGRRMQQFGIDAGQRNELFQQAGKEAEQLAKLRGGGKIDSAEFTRLRDERFRDLIESYGYSTGQIEVEIKPVIAENDIPELLKGNTKTGGSGRTGGRTPKADPGADGEEIIKQLNRQIALTEAKDKLEKSLLESQYEYIDNLEAASEIQDASLRTLAEQAAAQLLGLQRQEAYTEYVQEGLKAQMALQDAQDAALAPLTDRQKYLQDALKYGREEADIRQQIYNITKDQPNLDEARVEEIVRGNAALEESLTKAEKLQAITDNLVESSFQRLGQAIEDSLVRGIEAAVSGAESLNDVLQEIASTLLKDLGRMFINAGISGLGARFNIPGFADGGTPEPNSVNIVGEQGPELLLTGNYASRVLPNDVFEDTKAALIASGDVAPVDANDETADAIAANKSSIENTYNNIASAAAAAEYFGDSYSAMKSVNTTYSNRSATTMNEAQTAALQSAGTDTTIRYESVTINEIEYVTREEAEKIGKQSAKAAKADVYRELRNRPATRSRVGV